MAAKPRDPNRRLTQKQVLFIAKYRDTGNLSTAYQYAYDTKNMNPVTIRTTACAEMRKPHVRAAYQNLCREMAEAQGLDKGRVLEEWIHLALLNPAEILEALADGGGTAAALRQLPEEHQRAISQADIDDETGRITRIRFRDQTKALEMLSKHLGLLDRDEGPARVVIDVRRGREDEESLDV